MKYLDQWQSRVGNESGWSGEASAPEVVAWLLDGNTIEPFDPGTVPTPAELRLAEIDEDGKLTPRAFRELVILMAEGFKIATGGALDLKAIVPGVARVFALEEEAVALREQLTKD